MASQGEASRSQIELRASQWLAQRDGGRWSEVDEQRLNEWLEQSAGHMVAFLRLEEAWNATRRLKALDAGNPTDAAPAQGAVASAYYFSRAQAAEDSDRVTNPTTYIPRRARYFAVAACLLVAIGSAALVLRAGPGSGTSYTTPIGGIARVPMTDGSKVTLNTDSQVRIVLSDSERQVHLEHGEAFFEVSKDLKRPFVVDAAGRRVVAVGTEFSVRQDPNGLEVVVTEGRVRIDGLSRSAPDVQLNAGSIAQVKGGSVLVQAEPLAEVEERLSWRSGYLVFHMTPLADAVARFNRYTARKIVIEDPAVGAIRIGGSFRTDNVDAFVRLLQDGFSIKTFQRDDMIVLTGH